MEVKSMVTSENRKRKSLSWYLLLLAVSFVLGMATFCMTGCSTICEATMGAVDGARHDYHATVKALHRDVEADEARDGTTDARR
jgi:hypothetical protein